MKNPFLCPNPPSPHSSPSHPIKPILCKPSNPIPSTTKGKALPSFIPASHVSAKRNLSWSPGCLLWTSVASTGSVGATMAPSKMAAPADRCNTKQANSAISATLTTIETEASKIGMRHRHSLTGTGILTPAEKSEINTATSVSASRNSDCFSGLK